MGAMYERLSVGDRVPEYLTNDILIRMDYVCGHEIRRNLGLQAGRPKPHPEQQNTPNNA